MIPDTICSILTACALPVNASVGHGEGEYVNVAAIEIDRLKAGDRIAILEAAGAEAPSPTPGLRARPAPSARRSRATSFSSSRARRFAASRSSFGKPIFAAA